MAWLTKSSCPGCSSIRLRYHEPCFNDGKRLWSCRCFCLLTRTYNNPEYEYHNFSYEKQADGARLLMLTSSLDVTVCSHAHSTIDATTYPCTNYVGALSGLGEARARDVPKGLCSGSGFQRLLHGYKAGNLEDNCHSINWSILLR